jgi:hypothetical protein
MCASRSLGRSKLKGDLIHSCSRNRRFIAVCATDKFPSLQKFPILFFPFLFFSFGHILRKPRHHLQRSLSLSFLLKNRCFFFSFSGSFVSFAELFAWGARPGVPPKFIAPICCVGGATRGPCGWVCGFGWAGWAACGGGVGCGSGSNKCAGACCLGCSAGIPRRRLSVVRSPTWRAKSDGVSMWDVTRKTSRPVLRPTS